MKDTLTVELTEEEVSFLRELLFAYDDNAQSLDEMYLNLIEKISFDREDDFDRGEDWELECEDDGEGAYDDEGELDDLVFHVGDKVRIIASGTAKITHYFEVGEVAVIELTDEADSSVYCIRESGLSQWVNMSEIELVEKHGDSRSEQEEGI